jgi:hypothetical protein
VPFDPDQVYQKLTVQLKTPTPPPSRSSNTQSSCLQTPQNPRQFKHQTSTIKKHISRRSTSPLDIMAQAMDRLSKAHEYTTHENLILRKENHNLRAAHEKEKQKRRRSRKQISHEQGITREEAQVLISRPVEASQTVTTAPAEPELPASQPPVRRQFHCSGCGIAGHKITGCPNRTSN